MTDAGGVKCWGSNYVGQLGDGTTKHRRTPVDVLRLRAGVQAITVGFDHTCAITRVGGAKCWGQVVGDGTTKSRRRPVDVSHLTTGVQAITGGGLHSCATTDAGRMKCWGDNDYGQIGDGTRQARLTRVRVSGLTRGIQAITAGGSHTCAITAGGIVKCWGANFHGQLGDGTRKRRVTPVDVVFT